MPFFTNNAGPSSVGKIENYEEGLGTPTSFRTLQNNIFEVASVSYNIVDSKNGTIDTTELTTVDTTNEYFNTGPKDYANYYGSKEAGKLYFTNVITSYVLIFPAIIDSYNESFKPNFESEQIYGRTDSTQKYVNTSRTLSLSFKVLAYDEEHARKNLHAVSTLVQFLYPTYDGSNSGESCSPLAIREPPFMRVRFSNLIQRSGRGDSTSNYFFSKDGLLTVPTSFSFTPELEAGFFFSNDDEARYLYPKEIKISMGFNVLHEETIGWVKPSSKYHWVGKLDSNGNLVKKNVDFPWGNDTIDSDVVNGTSASEAAANVGSAPTSGGQ